MLEAQLGPEGRNYLFGWNTSNPAEVRRMHHDGTLLPRLKEAERESLQIIERAHREGMTHLSNLEIYELYGAPSMRL